MAQQPLTGRCRLCDREEVLSREHIPPKGAYGGISRRMEVQDVETYLASSRGRIYQGGFHVPVLCERCNNSTGTWYGGEFARWSEFGVRLLATPSPTKGPGPNCYCGYPLRIAKQIIATMIAASSPDLTKNRSDLRTFALDRTANARREQIALSAYFCVTGMGRTTGVAVAMRPGNAPHRLVEFALPPFGYVLTLDGTSFDARPVDIGWFTTCGYDEQCEIDVTGWPRLPTHEAFPADYRTFMEIRRDVIVNILDEQGRPNSLHEAERILRSGEGPAFFAANDEVW